MMDYFLLLYYEELVIELIQRTELEMTLAHLAFPANQLLA